MFFSPSPHWEKQIVRNKNELSHTMQPIGIPETITFASNKFCVISEAEVEYLV